MMQTAERMVRVATPKDSRRILEILRHPEVEPSMFHDGIPPLLETAKGISGTMDKMTWLLWEGGLFLAVPVLGGCAEVHIAVLPEWRGRKALEAARQAVDVCFTVTNHSFLFGSTHAENRPALAFLNAVGFRTARVENDRSVSCLSLIEWVLMKPDVREFTMACASNGQLEKASFLEHVHKYTTRRQDNG